MTAEQEVAAAAEAMFVEDALWGIPEHPTDDDIRAYWHHLARAALAATAVTIATAEDMDALPVGSVVMTLMTVEPYEHRIWQKFGGSREWLSGWPRHEWQATDGGFVRVGQPADCPLMGPRIATLLYRPESSR